MKISRGSWSVWFVLGFAVLDCGAPQRAGDYTWQGRDDVSETQVDLAPGTMPAGDGFTGVYRSAQIGDIELVQSGDTLTGTYVYDRASCHVLGTLEGRVQGNLLRFAWTEDKRACGYVTLQRGHGFFLYTVDHNENITVGRLFGRWGYNTDERNGGPWTANRIAGRVPAALQNADGGTAPAPSP